MMKQSKQKCQHHNLPFTKIETNTKRLLCQKCINENEDERRQRLQIQRVKLYKAYIIELGDLRQVKKNVDRLVELFTSKNMSEAKKIINKSSPDIQKIVQGLIEKQVKEANKILKDRTQELLQPWKNIDGRIFNSNYLQFEQQEPKIDRQLNELRQTLKQRIAQKLKHEGKNLLLQFV